METQINEQLSTSETQLQIPEVKESIKLTKNSKSYNYEFRVIAVEGTNLLDRLEYVRGEIEKKIKRWEGEKNVDNKTNKKTMA